LSRAREPKFVTDELRPILDHWLRDSIERINYIHGEEVIVRGVESGARRVAIILPPSRKEKLF
jgi:uncharacterized protein (DUF1015 family)